MINLDNIVIPIFNLLYNFIHTSFLFIATFFGYPENPGMPVFANFSKKIVRSNFLYGLLPKHKTFWPTRLIARSWLEVFFGISPRLELVPRMVYENKNEGFYNFYILNFKNSYYLSDALSTFLQVRLHVCLDITVLENIREVAFIALFVFYYFVRMRFLLMWFVSINPMYFPWYIIIGIVDWCDELLHGATPSVLGINIISTFLLGFIGSIGDNLNHLVFTMPFLPSEGEPAIYLIDGELRHVLVFHYLPILWYLYPIPNELREFWYYTRPDILEYMQKVYGNLNIQFLPNNILK